MKEKRNKKKKPTKKQKRDKALWGNYLSKQLSDIDILGRTMRTLLQDDYYGLNDMPQIQVEQMEHVSLLHPKKITCSCGKEHCTICKGINSNG